MAENERVAEAFRSYLSDARIRKARPASTSEDFGSFGPEQGVPLVFWFVGGTDPDVYAKAKAANKLNDLPANQNPGFLPVIHPTLETGVETRIGRVAGMVEGLASRSGGEICANFPERAAR